jgi:D-amino-acid dehydrogenase
MSQTKSVAPRIMVVGAGIVGVCCAVHLRREGHSVSLLEAEEPAAGASRGNAGALSPGSCIPLSMPGLLKDVPGWLIDRNGPLVVRPSYFLQVMPWLFRFIAAGRATRIPQIVDALHALHSPVFDSYMPLLQAAGIEYLIRRTGSLTVYRHRRGLESAMCGWKLRRERGVDFEVLDQRAIHDIVPALANKFECGVFQPQHGYVANPQSLVQRLAEHFTACGGELLIGRAARVEPQNEAVTIWLEDGRRLEADRVVIAAGASSKPLLDGLGLAIPLETQRGYHLHLPEPGVELPLPVSFADAKFYATPMEHGLRLAGTVEFARPSAKPDFRRARQLGTMAMEWLPGLRLANASEWMGRRPCTPDSLPVIGPLPTDRRILLAFGHGHNGMTSAPTTGRLIADLMADRKPFIDVSPYRPDRF